MNLSGTISLNKIYGASNANIIYGDANLQKYYGLIRYPDIIISSTSEEPETTALLARMSVQPSSTLKTLINKTIKDLKDAGIWSLLDCLYFANIHTQQASLLNWISSSYDLTLYNSPTWTQGVGIQTGLSKYINSNYSPSAVGAKFTSTSSSISFKDWQDIRAAYYRFYNSSSATVQLYMNPGTIQYRGRNYQTATQTYLTAGSYLSNMLNIVQRTGSNLRIWNDSTKVIDGTIAATTTDCNGTMIFNNDGGTGMGFVCGHIGASLYGYESQFVTIVNHFNNNVVAAI